ncbi:hypothetical protein D9M70_436840 [compost metagenome]
MARDVLHDRHVAGLKQAIDYLTAERCDEVRIGAEGAGADHRAGGCKNEVEHRRAAARETKFAHHRAHGLARKAKRLLAEGEIAAGELGELAEGAKQRPGTGVEMLDAAAFLVGEDRGIFAANRFAKAFDQRPCLRGFALVAAADEEPERIGLAEERELVIRERGIGYADKEGKRGRGHWEAPIVEITWKGGAACPGRSPCRGRGSARRRRSLHRNRWGLHRR